MILYDRDFERRVKRAVRSRLKTMPGWRKRYPRRARQYSVQHPAIAVPVAAICLAGFLFNRVEAGYPRAFLFLPLSLYSLHYILSRALRIQTIFLNSPERWLLRFFPFSDAQYFRWAMDSFFYRSGFYWAISCAAYLALLPQEQPAIRILLSLCGATLNWLLALTAIFLLAPALTRVPRWLPFMLSLSCAAPFFLPAANVGYAAALEWAIPFGWIAQFFLHFSKIPFAWIWLAPLLGAFSVACYFALRRLQPIYEEKESFPVPPIPSEPRVPQERYVEKEYSEAEAYDELVEGSVAQPVATQQMSDAHVQKLQEFYSSSAVAKFIRTGTSLDPWDWSQAPLLERWCVSLLTPHERDVLEFLLGSQPPNWTSLWRFSVIAAGIAVAAAFLPAAISTTVFIIAGLVSALAGMPLLGNWIAFSTYQLTGKLSPIHSCFPLDYWETFRLLAKIALVRSAAWLPIGLILGAVFGRSMGIDALGGAYELLILFLTVLGSFPVICALHFSSNTNDSQSRKFSALVFVFAAGIYGIVELLGIIYSLTPGAPMGYVVPPVLTGISFLAWALYGRYYARGRFDLLRVPK